MNSFKINGDAYESIDRVRCGVEPCRVWKTCPALPCPARPGQGMAGYAPNRAGQGKVTAIFTGQVAGYERRNLSTCNNFDTSRIIDIFSKVIHKKQEDRKQENINR
jgi:hypothetical protein